MVHVLDGNADVTTGVMVMDVRYGLEARRQAPELGPLRRLGVGTLHGTENPLHALRVRRIDIGHLGLQLPAHGLAIQVELGAFCVTVPGTVDVLENPVWIGPVAHEGLRKALNKSIVIVGHRCRPKIFTIPAIQSKAKVVVPEDSLLAERIDG
jgi:hypothetical protein